MLTFSRTSCVIVTMETCYIDVQYVNRERNHCAADYILRVNNNQTVEAILFNRIIYFEQHFDRECI